MRHTQPTVARRDGGPGAVQLVAARSRTVIVLSGEVDLDVADQMSHVAHEAAARELPIRVDVRAATFIDSSAMTMFVRLVMTERRHKRDVVVVGASPVIRMALQTAGIARLLAFEDAE